LNAHTNVGNEWDRLTFIVHWWIEKVTTSEMYILSDGEASSDILASKRDKMRKVKSKRKEPAIIYQSSAYIRYKGNAFPGRSGPALVSNLITDTYRRAAKWSTDHISSWSPVLDARCQHRRDWRSISRRSWWTLRQWRSPIWGWKNFPRWSEWCSGPKHWDRMRRSTTEQPLSTFRSRTGTTWSRVRFLCTVRHVHSMLWYTMKPRGVRVHMFVCISKIEQLSIFPFYK